MLTLRITYNNGLTVDRREFADEVGPASFDAIVTGGFVKSIEIVAYEPLILKSVKGRVL